MPAGLDPLEAGGPFRVKVVPADLVLIDESILVELDLRLQSLGLPSSIFLHLTTELMNERPTRRAVDWGASERRYRRRFAAQHCIPFTFVQSVAI